MLRLTVLIENSAPAHLIAEHGLSLHLDYEGHSYLLDSGTSGTHNNVASGGYKVCIAVDYVTQTLESQGSPIKFVYPAEDTIAISSPIALVKGCANPDNGKLLYDFILSEEGQTVLMKADCTPIRDGVAKEGALSASEIAAIALKPDEAKLAQEKQDTLDHFDQLFK